MRADLIGIIRCHCGNRMTTDKLDADGRCPPCVRERQERQAKAQEERERAERIAFYRDSLSFWSAR